MAASTDGRVFLDSNVFIYAAGRRHALKEPCVAVLHAVARGSLDAVTSAEVVQEVLHVVGRRADRQRASRLATAMLDMFPQALPVTPQDMRTAAALFAAHSGISTRDAVHVATMRSHGIATIISADGDFDSVPGIERLDPRRLTGSG